MGRHARRAEARAGPPDGGLRRLPGAHRPPHRPAGRRPRRDPEALDNTLVFYIIGDNGASAEGHINGSFNEYLFFNGAAALETPEFMAARIDQFGTAAGVQPLLGRVGARDGHALPVDQAGGLPLGRHPQRHRGPLAGRDQSTGRGPPPVPPRDRHRPDRPRRRGHPHPERVTGSPQDPLHGVSMRYSFDEQHADDRHTTQYFEIGGNRGIYHQGWTAVTKHATPWIAMAELPAFADDVWELYAPRGLDPGQRPRSDHAREARGAPGAVPGRGPPVQRASPGRPPSRAVRRQDRRPPGTDLRAIPDPVRRHGPAHRVLGDQHEERLPRSGRRRRDP